MLRKRELEEVRTTIAIHERKRLHAELIFRWAMKKYVNNPSC
jgi:hypothetical protein